jgi:hypothetical protein
MSQGAVGAPSAINPSRIQPPAGLATPSPPAAEGKWSSPSASDNPSAKFDIFRYYRRHG